MPSRRKWLISLISPRALVPLPHAVAYLDNACHYCVLWGSLMDKSVDGISRPAAYMAPFDIMKIGQQEGHLLGRTHMSSPCPVNKVSSVFHSRVLLSSSSGQPRATAVDCIA